MSPDLPASEPPSYASGMPPTSTPPRRAGTILGQLSKAVREQNWFAVALEVVIVVVGVVMGFQVTAWGQAQNDRAKEQTYLRQLATDLAETERILLAVDSLNRPGGEALVKFIRAFSADPRPPADSLFQWGWDTRLLASVTPVLGTAEALVSTGDIGLIRDDSLRSAIVAYLDAMRLGNEMRQSINDNYVLKYEGYLRRFDMGRAAQVALSPSEIDSLARVDYLFADAPSPGPRPYPAPDRMLEDRELHAALRNLLDTRTDLRLTIQGYLAGTRALAALVQEELDR